MNNKIAVIYNFDDKAKEVLVDYQKIYCLTHKVYSQMDDDFFNNKIIKCILPTSAKNKIIDEETIFKNKVLQICNKIFLNNCITYNIQDILIDIFRIIKNIEYSLEENDDIWLYNDYSIRQYKKKEELISELIIFFYNKKLSIFNIFENDRNSLIKKFLINFNNQLIKLKNINRELYCIDSIKNYKKIFKFNKNNLSFISFYPKIRPSLKQILKVFIFNFINKNSIILLGSKDIETTVLKISKTNKFAEYDDILNFFFNKIYRVTNEILFTLEKYYQDMKITYSIADNHKPILQSCVAYLTSKYNRKNILVPHGSISLQTKKYFKDEVNSRAKGIVYSNYDTFVVAQSKIAFDYICKKIDRNKIIINQPLLWSYVPSIAQSPNKDKVFTFLIASTMKDLRTKNLMYDDSFEFYEMLNFLHLFLKSTNINNIKFLIRFRSSNELSFSDISHFQIKNKLEISNNISLVEDLSLADILLSNSSTCLEEALYSQIPIGLFSNTGYSHFTEANIKINTYPIFKININNLHYEIPIVINAVNEEKTKSFSKFIWDEKLNNFHKFISSLSSN